jgi:HK97 family phage major capsid protein
MTSWELEHKRRELQRLSHDLDATSRAWYGQTMPATIGRDFSAKVAKAEKLWDEIEANTPAPGSVPIPVPRTDRTAERKERAQMSKQGQTPGEVLVESDIYRELRSAGWPRAASPKVYVPDWSAKAIPSLSVSNATTYPVVEADRDPDIVRAAEFERLRVRDAVTVSSTSGDTVQFVRITSDKPSAAEGVAAGTEKPESTMALSVASVPVRTLAVWLPVTEQQLEDVGQLRGIVDQELRFDVARLEEYQMIWGDGTVFLGVMETPGVVEFTRTLDVGAGSAVTLLDEIRGAVSDVIVAGYEPNVVLLHPYDVEALSIGKGTDEHYLSLAMAIANRPVVWNLQIIESLAAESYRDGLSTHQRVAIVGDFRRGATLWDRHKASVEVGYIDRQFVENVRTIRAEERAAFAVKRPLAFKYIETQAASAS